MTSNSASTSRPRRTADNRTADDRTADDRTPAGRETSAGRIALIRHGETGWSATGRHTSVTDVDLTVNGQHRAGTIPGLLAGLQVHPTAVLVSPRRRARRTAALAGLEPASVTDDLAEWDYGDFEGLTTRQIRADRPNWELFADGCPGGETPGQVAERSDRLLRRAREMTRDGDVALVCHGHISRALAVRWVGLPIVTGALLAMDAAAVTVLGFHHGDPVIEHANVVAFRQRHSRSQEEQ